MQRHLCAGTTLFLILTSLASAGDWSRVDERLAARLAGPGDSAAIWVFLSSKDPFGDGLARTVPPATWVSARARERCLKRGLPTPVDDDRPIAESAVRELTDAGLRVRTVSRWLTAVSGWVDNSAAEELTRLPWVDSLRLVQTYHRAIEQETGVRELPKPGAPPELDYGPSLTQLAQIGIVQAHRAGYFGEGILIGFLDTGFNPAVAAFDSTHLIATRDFINGDSDVADGDPVQMDHGTKTWSVCAAYVPGELIGAAYRADFALAKTEIVNQHDVQIEEDFYVAGLEWYDSLGVDIVSSSLGYPDFYQYGDLNGRTAITTKGVNRAASRGILVVTAAGNEGSKSYPWITPPADSDSALAVGAVDSDGRRVGFSSIGPTTDGRIKPDVMAMGSGVWVANHIDGQYGSASGTSFATPLTASACALLLEKHPSMQPMEVIARMRETASQANQPDNLMGYGIVNLRAAMDLGRLRVSRTWVSFEAVQFADPPEPKTIWIVNDGFTAMHWSTSNDSVWLSIDPDSGTVAPDDSTEATLNIGAPGRQFIPGEYRDTITVTAPDAHDSPQQVVVNFRLYSNETTAHNEPIPFDPSDPVQPNTMIHLQLAERSAVEIRIFDLAGVLVKTLAAEWASAEKAEFAWDGRADDGPIVADGVYLCHIKITALSGGTREQVLKIAVLKK